MSEPSYDVIDALKLIPLFYTINWTPEKKAEWLRITGCAEATTKVLCDHVRSAIAILESPPKLIDGELYWIRVTPEGEPFIAEYTLHSKDRVGRESGPAFWTGTHDVPTPAEVIQHVKKPEIAK